MRLCFSFVFFYYYFIFRLEDTSRFNLVYGFCLFLHGSLLVFLFVCFWGERCIVLFGGLILVHISWNGQILQDSLDFSCSGQYKLFKDALCSNVKQISVKKSTGCLGGLFGNNSHAWHSVKYIFSIKILSTVGLFKLHQMVLKFTAPWCVRECTFCYLEAFPQAVKITGPDVSFQCLPETWSEVAAARELSHFCTAEIEIKIQLIICH